MTDDPAVKAQRSGSFGQVASDYDRFRPGPPRQAIAWLLPERVDMVVDLGAGTGALDRGYWSTTPTRWSPSSPTPACRAVLAAEVPGATAVEGRGESIPLPDGAADAAIASSSWHWMELETTLHEVGRVLKPGGVLGVLWSGPDADSPFMAQARALLGAAVDEAGATSSLAQTVGGQLHATPDFALKIPPGTPFLPPETEVVRFGMGLTADELVGLLGTLSWVILMPPAERDELFATTRRLLRDGLGLEGDATVDVDFRCDVFRARRRG